MGKVYIGGHLLADTKETMLCAASDVGAIFMWGSDMPPKGCMLCDGSAYSRSGYSQLFNKIGTTFGAGDGSTTFNVPDMCGRVAVGRDTTQTGFDTLNDHGGEKAHTLNIEEIPYHHHMNISNINYPERANVAGTDWTISPVQRTGYETGSATSDIGGDRAHNNLQPYRVLNFVIRYLPSQNADKISDTLPLGTIVEYSSDIMPDNWLLCDGQAISRVYYSELFAVIGVKYGSGDSSTTFNIPDMRGRVAVGKDTSQTEFDMLNTPSNYKGEKAHQLIATEMPAHSHASGGRSAYTSYWASGSTTQNGVTVGDKQNTGDTGGSGTHNNLQPYRVLNYIIKAKNTVPVEAMVEDTLTSASTSNALSAKQGKLLDNRLIALENDTGWIAPTLQNGWANYGYDGHAVAGYRKEGRRVTLKGLIRGGVSGTIVFTLPESFRPSEILIFCAMSNNGIARIDVKPDGSVVSYYGGNDFQSLSQISFLLD